MPLTRLDTGQRDAASAQGHEVVVSAGAGSGKTRLLVGRYLHLLDSRAITMNEIAAITFTEKAANQMKVEIAEQARALAAQEGRDREFWLGIAGSVHSAPISTIHGFCNAILRAHPVEGRLDPLFGILDGATTASLAGEAVDSFLRRRLDSDPEGIERLIRDFGMRDLKELLRDLLGQRTRLITWLDRFGSADAAELERRYEAWLIAEMTSIRLNLGRFHTLAPGDDSLAGKLAELVPALTVAVSMMEDGAITPAVIDNIVGAAGSLRGGSKKRWGACGCDVAVVKDCIKGCRDFLGIVRDYYRRDKGVTARTAFDLLQEYTLLDDHFLAMKKERSAFDHDDTLIETWRLLRNDIGVRQEVVRSYRHIMVDEFQDTDGLQMDILQMIVGNGTTVFFAVGDPKQSIYRFRGADVSIFNKYVESISGYKSLKKNYRSDPGIIAFVNRVFGRVMGNEPSAGDTGDDHYEAFYTEMKPPGREPLVRPRTRIAVFENGTGEAWRLREAEWIAAGMRELHDREDLPYGKMALILRKSTHAAVYQESFLAHGIPYVDLAGNKPFAGTEARDIATLLTWLCEPENPVAFTALLLSPFVAAGAGHVFALRRIAGAPGKLTQTFRFSPDVPGHPWLDGLDVAGGRSLLDRLLALRDRASIREVLETAFELTGYTPAILADPVRGELALAVTDLILDTADSFERNGGDIREFARLLVSGGLDADESPGVESRGDAVNIITIHKAKGLEYEAVFCADIAGRQRNDARPILIDRELGIGFSMRDTCGKRVRTIVSAIGREKEKRKNIAESKRLFYVACTRARSRLFLSGGAPPSKLNGAYETDNWMEWLHSALELSSSGEIGPDTPGDLFHYERIAGDTDTVLPCPETYWDDVLATGETDGAGKTIEPDIAAEIARLAAVPGTVAAGQPEHLSPSRIEDYLACPGLYRYRHIYGIEPPRIAGAGGYGPRYGSFAHRVLERWDFHDDPEAAIEAAVPEDSAWPELLAGQLGRFRETELYRSILASDTVSREMPFGLLHNGVMVRGSIDCLAERGGAATIIDFKTDRIEPGTAGETARKYHLQLALYALAVQRSGDRMPAELVIYFLDTSETVAQPCTEAFLAEAAEAIEQAADGISRGDFAPHPGDVCGDCPYRSVCGK